MNVQSYFYELAGWIESLLRGDEVVICAFAGEHSDFVRFNRSRVRQAGAVTQRELSVDLIAGRRHVSGRMTLSGVADADRPRVARLVGELRARREDVPEDPFLLYATDVRSTERTRAGRLPDGAELVHEVAEAGGGRDLVGVYAAGDIHAGFANSLGQRNWFESRSFHLDWSFYHAADKAVKASYAGFDWNPEEFRRTAAQAAEQLRVVAQPARTLPPGRYRVYLAPAALCEIFDTLGWGGFGLRAHRTRSTPLLAMITEGKRLHPSIHLSENTTDGIAPDFEAQGFIRPDCVPLIDGGVYRQCLVSPRSAAEYDVPGNGAAAGESPESLDMNGGDLPSDRVLATLDTGIYVNNLWYLNYSDRSAARLTGMTRFAAFYVRGGTICEPLNVMRFDETIYRMLGEHLAGLSRERQTIFDSSSYARRSTRSARLPGAIIDDFTFTL